METQKFKSIKKTLLIIIAIISLGRLQAQTPNSVGIGTTNPDNSAILHLESSNQGFLMTRLTTTQINAIVTPTVGLIIYNTVDQCYWYKRPGYWARLCNTDSINASSVITNTFHSDTTFTNVNNFGNGYGDSIWVHYASIDTAIINNLTVHTINADSIYLGGNSITTVITDSITKLAWLLKGNTGTNPAINFLGTIDNQDLVLRTNNTEKIRVTAPGNVGIGTSVPHSSAILELKGTDKGFLMTSLTTAQINAIVTPTVGLITYNTDDNCYWYKHPYGWKRICNTDSLGNVFISTLTTNTINAQTINTSTINASAGSFTTITTNSLTTNIYNFGNGIGDSIWVHYAQIDTAYIHQLTVNTIKADSIYLGGNSITTVITDSITNLAWLLKGNTGTNPAVNFLGTKDNQDLVIRTNNTENIRVTASGNTGFGTPIPTNKVEVIGNTKTTNFQMTSGAANGYVLQSNAVGSGSWTPLATMVSTLAPGTFSANAWTLLGNTGTNPAVNFLGTTNNQRLVIRTNNTEKFTILPTGEAGFQTSAPTQAVDVNGKIRLRTGAALGYILQSDAVGVGTWTTVSSVVSVLTPTVFNSNAWTLLGNSATTSSVNFLGTTDGQDLNFRTNNVNTLRLTVAGKLRIIKMANESSSIMSEPQYSSLNNYLSGLSIYDNNCVSLKNKYIHFLYNDSLGNTIFSQPVVGSSVPLIFSNNSTANYIINGGLTNNSSENFVVNGNNLTNSDANVVFNAYRIQANTLTGSSANFVAGYSNNINTGRWNYAIGKTNTISSSDNNFILGNENIINPSLLGANVVIGFNNISNCYNSVSIGSNITNTVNFSLWGSAPGGIRLTSNFGQTAGVTLATGAGAWASISDRKMKENITEISNKTILDKILSVPVTEWTYISQKVDTMNKYAAKGIYYDKAPVHIGPMAQDFSEVFGYGEFKDKITTSDIDGVMFSGIQALAEENKQLKAKIEKLEAVASEIEELKKLVNELKNR